MERFLACLLLVVLLPLLLLVTLLIYSNAEGAIVITDEVLNTRGQIIRRLRFWTTGRGSAFFPALGRCLRTYSIDEFPRLWNVVRGDLRLRDLLV